MTEILVVAPHPDDETLGAGGTLLRHRQQGDRVTWVVVTSMTPDYGDEAIRTRDAEIEEVAKAFGFHDYAVLGFPTARLDAIPRAEIVTALGESVKKFAPHTIYSPFPGDAHTDHRAVYEAVAAIGKWFRFPSVRRVLAYEAPSETDFGMSPVEPAFRPNVFVDISKYLDTKIAIAQLFRSEIHEFPFPRSIEAIRSLAMVRGAAAGFTAAEAFMLLRERVS